MILAQGDYVRVNQQVAVRKNSTTLRIASGSIGRLVRPADTPGNLIVLLGNWHIRLPETAVSRIASADSALPFSWVNRFLSDVRPTGRQR
jgi:hypothetical protein